MADPVIAFTTRDLLAALVVLLGAVAGLCVWIFHNTVANIRKELQDQKEQFVQQLEAQNKKLAEAIIALNEATEEGEALLKDVDKQVHILRERIAMLFRLTKKQ